MSRIVTVSVVALAARRASLTVSASSSLGREPRNSNPSALNW